MRCTKNPRLKYKKTVEYASRAEDDENDKNDEEKNEND